MCIGPKYKKSLESKNKNAEKSSGIRKNQRHLKRKKNQIYHMLTSRMISPVFYGIHALVHLFNISILITKPSLCLRRQVCS